MYGVMYLGASSRMGIMRGGGSEFALQQRCFYNTRCRPTHGWRTDHRQAVGPDLARCGGAGAATHRGTLGWAFGNARSHGHGRASAAARTFDAPGTFLCECRKIL